MNHAITDFPVEFARSCQLGLNVSVFVRLAAQEPGGSCGGAGTGGVLEAMGFLQAPDLRFRFFFSQNL